MLLMACLTLIPTNSNVANPADNLSSTAQNLLLSLDSNGHLAKLINDGDWLGLKNCVGFALPLTVWFNLTVFDQNMNILNPYPICDAGSLSEKITSIDYVCVSQNSTYSMYILQLQLSQAGD